MTNPETGTGRFFPERKFKDGQLVEYSFGNVKIRGRIHNYIQEGSNIIAVMHTPDGQEYADDQEKFSGINDE